MKIFLSAMLRCATKDGISRPLPERLVEAGVHMQWNLMSYYEIRGRNGAEKAVFVRDHTDEILIDSGAHSFQKGIKVDFDEYTRKYARFIAEFDRPNVLGYFEMDIDNIVGYDKVLEYRRVLESVSNKVIPVWHKNRGVDDYKKMCQENAGKIVAITGFKNEDIRDRQYITFLKYAKDYGCKVHCLGMTRKEILDEVPFDFVDSSSWMQYSIYGKRYADGKRVTREITRTKMADLLIENYKYGVRLQNYYHRKWQSICKD